MSDNLRNEDIDAVLCELEHGVSEADIEPQSNDEAVSEVSDHEEYESEHPSSADDTDADPTYYPSDEDQPPQVPSRFHWEDSNEEEDPAAEMEICNQPENVSSHITNTPVDIFDPNLPSTSINTCSINSAIPTSGDATPQHNQLSNESLQINVAETCNDYTIVTMDIDALEKDDVLDYQPSSGDSSTDEFDSDMEPDLTEVTDLYRTRDRQVCNTAQNSNLYLSSLVSHKNIVIPKRRNLKGKNGHKWSSKPKTRSNRPQRRNIVHIRQRPINNAQNVTNPADCFKLFITPSIVDEIVVNTNVEISIKSQTYSKQSATVVPTNSTEINALLGLLVLTAAMKDNHLNSKELFDPTFSGTRYVSVMSRDRFDFLLNSLRFDDKASRADRRKTDKFAAVRGIWDRFIESCRHNYCPGSYVTIDEQLLGFRGRCPFRMYLPSKPSKYGIKILMLCDVKTKYLIDGMPYLGKSSNTSGLPLGAYYTIELTKSIHGTNRNVTMDNWFTSIPLVKDLLRNQQLTAVGTLRSDKKEIPPEMKDLKSRKIDSVMFAYDNELVLLSYKAKKAKMVYLVSTTHEHGTIAERTGKAEIVEFYNSTKGAVDAFDEMSSNMSCSRKTQRWPLCIFYGMINSTLVNSYVVYVHNIVKEGKKPICRREFAKEVCEELTKPHLMNRIQIPSLKKNLKVKIQEILGDEMLPNDPEPQEPAGRKICAYCPSKKRRMTRYSCFSCKKFYCLEHQAKMCTDCS